jgi:hypothetical protein
VVARWTVVDPKRQFYSPYVGMGNNPVSGTDPDGGGVLDVIFQNKSGQELGRIVNDQPDQYVTIDTDMTVGTPLVIDAAQMRGNLEQQIQALGFGIELSATFGGGMSGGYEFVYYLAGKNKDQLFMYDKFGGNLGFEGSAGVYGFAAWSSDKSANITSDSWLGIFNSYSGGYGAASGGYFWGAASGKAQLWPGQNGEKPYWQGVSVMGAYSFGAKAGAKWSFQKYTYVENLSLFNVNVTHGRVTFGK